MQTFLRIHKNNIKFAEYLTILKKYNKVKPFELYDMDNSKIPNSMIQIYINCIDKGYVCNHELDSFYDLYKLFEFEKNMNIDELNAMYKNFKDLYYAHSEMTWQDLLKLQKV